jgi:hypothetical protein
MKTLSRFKQWRIENPTFLKKYVSIVYARSTGEKNGNAIGLRLNIAVKNVQKSTEQNE